MKNVLNLIALIFIASLFYACSCNPIQPVLILTMRDMFILGVLYLALAFVLALYLTANKSRGWLYFWIITGIIVLPFSIVAAIIKSLSKTSK